MKLSPAQKAVLERAERVICRSEHDATMMALARKGFAEWHSALGHRYGRPSWWITDAGRAALSPQQSPQEKADE